MKKIILSVLLGMVSLSVNAECFTTEGYVGAEIREFNSYQPAVAGPTDNELLLVFDGEKSSDGNYYSKCKQVEDDVLMMICQTGFGEKQSVDVWNVDKESGLVFYTKNVIGYDKSKLNGISFYIGTVTGRCDM